MEKPRATRQYSMRLRLVVLLLTCYFEDTHRLLNKLACLYICRHL